MFSHRYSLLPFTFVHIGGFNRGARTCPIFGRITVWHRPPPWGWHPPRLRIPGSATGPISF